MRNFIIRALRRSKLKKLNEEMSAYGFMLEYMKSVDRYCGSFVDHHLKYGDLINSHILWFNAEMSVQEIKEIVRGRFMTKKFYKSPTFYMKGE